MLCVCVRGVAMVVGLRSDIECFCCFWWLLAFLDQSATPHSPHAEHEHWEPGAKFESENQNDWHPSTGKYYHHEMGQPTGRMEPDKLDL